MPLKSHISIILLLLGFNLLNAQNPCLSGFRYRKPVTITNPAPVTQSGVVQIKFGALNLINAGKLKSDCSDLRFTDASGNSLDYWIDAIHSKTNSQSVWVEIPAMASGSIVYIYMFYGNVGAASQANTGIFEFFDHFDDASSLDDWIINSTASPVVNVNGSYLTVGQNTSLTSNAIFTRDFTTYSYVESVSWTSDSVVATLGQAEYDEIGYGLSYIKKSDGNGNFEIREVDSTAPYLVTAKKTGTTIGTTAGGLWAFTWKYSDKDAAGYPPLIGSIENYVDSVKTFFNLNTNISVTGNGSMTLDWIAVSEQPDNPFTYSVTSTEDDLGTGTIDITGTTNLCESSGDNITLNATLISGAYYTWVFKGVTVLQGSEENIYSCPGTLANSGTYKVLADLGTPTCSNEIADIDVLVDPQLVPGVLTGETETCALINNDSVKLTGYSGSIDHWEYRVLPGSIWNTMEITTDYYNYSGLSNSYQFRVFVDAGACGSSYSDSASITVSPTSNAGTLSESKYICTGNNDTLILSGFTGTINRWQKKTVTGSWESISHNDDTLITAILTESTNYRVLVSSGSCPADTSNNILLTVSPETDGGSVTGGKYVCYGTSKTDTLELTGYTGNIVRWEFSTGPDGPWSENTSHNAIFLYQGLYNTTYYRALVQSPGCEAQYSDKDTVTVETLPAGGTLEGSALVCASENSGTLKLSGYSGKILKWIQSADTGNSWATINNTSNTYNYSGLTTQRQYSVVLNTQHEVCNNDTSTIAIIDVSPATVPGTLYTPTTRFCKGLSSGTISILNKTGGVQYWESSSNGLPPWSNINIQTNSLIFGNLESTNYYRAIVKSGSCPTLITDSIRIRIDQPSVGGNILGSTEVCEAVNTGELTLVSSYGSITKWESTVNRQTWNTVPDASTEIYTFNNLIDTTWYRVITKSGLCEEDTSTLVKITVNPLPDVSFNADPVNLGNPTIFNNTTTIAGGSVQSWHWDFGNEESSASKSPKYTYPTAGTYRVKLTATSNKSCLDSASADISVFDLPDVNFTFTNVCLYSPTVFTNTSTIIPGTVYIWNFGDGSPEIAATDTIHTYLASGSYTVTLRAISSTGGEDFISKTVLVYPRSTPDFVFNNICEGATAHFSNRTTPTNLSLTFAWEFGNGQIDTRSDPETLYDLAGSYVVKLISTTSDGCADSISKPITVYPLPEADFTVEDVPYQQPSIFFNLSGISYGNLSYIWDFNDGTTSDTINPVHIYEAPGVYSVELTAISDSGCTDAIEKEVKVFALPVAKFTFNNVCIGDTMNFVNESTIPSGTLKYEWSFDDSKTSEDTDPHHAYQLAGEYNVRLICISDKNARDTVYHLVKVFDLPQVDFTFNESCDGFTTSFENSSTVSDGEIESVLWDFGDGSNSVQMNPDKDFLNPKIYKVNLEITSSTGCVNNEIKDVIVHPNPVADFEAEDVCFGSSTEFVNSSIIDNTYRPYTLTYQWNFNDGNSSTAAEPMHKYSDPGLYEVKLYARAGACIDSLIRFIEVYNLPEANAGEDTTVTKGFPIVLQASGGIFYEWMPPEGLSNISIAEPVARPMETTTYTLRVTDGNGCVNFDTILVTVEDELRIIPSNILTPNNNDENDTWNIVNIDSYPEAEIKIFDRWGKLIFETKDYRNDWQGTNSNGDILPDGTYYYVIVLSKEYNKIYKGAITLLRDK